MAKKAQWMAQSTSVRILRVAGKFGGLLLRIEGDGGTPVLEFRLSRCQVVAPLENLLAHNGTCTLMWERGTTTLQLTREASDTLRVQSYSPPQTLEYQIAGAHIDYVQLVSQLRSALASR